MKIAYITLTNSERYLQGAYNLYKSYLSVNSAIPFYCMITDDVNTNNFEDLPTIVIPELLNIYNYPKNWGYADKLNIFSLENFDFLIWLDADMLFLENFDNKIFKIIEEMVKNNFNFSCVFDLYNRWICGGMFIVKPDKNIYNKSIELMKDDFLDENILVKLYEKKYLFFDNYNKIIKEELGEIMNKKTLHWDNYANKKYWETSIGLFLYNYFLFNKKEAYKLIIELQKLFNEEVSIQLKEKENG